MRNELEKINYLLECVQIIWGLQLTDGFDAELKLAATDTATTAMRKKKTVTQVNSLLFQVYRRLFSSD